MISVAVEARPGDLTDAQLLGMILRDLRHAHQLRHVGGEGWTQDDVAKAVGIHPITLSDYELGKSQVPLDTLARMAELYGKTIPDLWNRISDMRTWLTS